MRILKANRIAILMLLIAASIVWGELSDDKPPELNHQQREDIRKFQLNDARYAAAISQRQVEIGRLQTESAQNAKAFLDYVATACGAKFQFDMNSDDLRCVEKPKPTPTPTPTPSEKKK